MQTTTVYLDSDSRSTGTLERPIIDLSPYGLTDVKSWRIKGIFIPFTYYVFNSNSNTITFSEGGAPITVTLANGNYNTTTMALEIAVKMNAATTVGNVYSVSFGPGSYQCNISAGGAAVAFRLDPTPSNSALYYLGWQYSSLTASAVTQTSPYSVRLSGPTHIYIRSAVLNTILYTTAFRAKVADRVICDIPCTALPGGAHVLNVGPLEKYVAHGKLFSLDFDLIDERGNPLGGDTGLNGVPWNLSIIFEHLK